MGRVSGVTLAQVKAGVKLNELQAPDGAVAMNSQKITGLAAATVAGDAIVADANVRAPDSSKLEGSNKATVQDHTPKAHTLASHSSKAHTELTGVTTSQHHAKYTNAEAQTTVKANVEVGDLKAPTKALVMAGQKITGLAAPAAQNDAVRADANLRAPDSSALEGSNKATVQNHTPKAHTLASHSTKAHTELTGVTAAQHHAKYTNAEAQTTVKANVEVGDLKSPTKALAMAGQKIGGLGAPAAQDDALRKGRTEIANAEIATAAAVARSKLATSNLTVLRFQALQKHNIGDATNIWRLIDGDLVTGMVQAMALNQWAAVHFSVPLHITQFRHYGNDQMNEDGFWKIQYMDANGDWVDWKTGIPTRKASWSGWDSTGGDVIAYGIKVQCTTLDSGAGGSNTMMAELEVKF